MQFVKSIKLLIDIAHNILIYNTWKISYFVFENILFFCYFFLRISFIDEFVISIPLVYNTFYVKAIAGNLAEKLSATAPMVIVITANQRITPTTRSVIFRKLALTWSHYLLLFLLFFSSFSSLLSPLPSCCYRMLSLSNETR